LPPSIVRSGNVCWGMRWGVPGTLQINGQACGTKSKISSTTHLGVEGGPPAVKGIIHFLPIKSSMHWDKGSVIVPQNTYE